MVEAAADRRLGGRLRVLFAWPFSREFFALDPSNVAATTAAFICGGVGIVLVEVSWTVTGRMLGEPRRLFAQDFF